MPADITSLLRIEVPVIVQIGERQMLLRDVLKLRPGAIIEFPKDTDEDIDLLVNNKPIGCGRAVKVGENFGIQITNIGTASETLKAMAGRAAEPPRPASSEKRDSDDPEKMTPFKPAAIGEHTSIEAA